MTGGPVAEEGTKGPQRLGVGIGLGGGAMKVVLAEAMEAVLP